MNPLFTDGDYPKVMIDEVAKKSAAEGRQWSRLPSFTDEERKSLIGSSDFLALNYYTSRKFAPKIELSDEPSLENDLGVEYFVDETWKQAKSQWLYNMPQGLYDLLKWIKDKYDNPIVLIAENGFSDDGQLDDIDRVEYLHGHLASVSRAISEGCNVIGYTVWSLIDNFEWTMGYTEKFGIFSVNMTSANKERAPKKSAELFKRLIEKKSFVYRN